MLSLCTHTRRTREAPSIVSKSLESKVNVPQRSHAYTPSTDLSYTGVSIVTHPLVDGAIVTRDALPSLIRRTCINLHRSMMKEMGNELDVTKARSVRIKGIVDNIPHGTWGRLQKG